LKSIRKKRESALGTWTKVRKERKSALGIWTKVFPWVVGLTLFTLAWSMVPLGFHLYYLVRSAQVVSWFGTMQGNVEKLLGMAGLSATAILGALASRAKVGGRLGALLRGLAILSGPILYLFVYFGVGYRMIFAPAGEAWQWQWVLAVTVAILLWAWKWVDVNTYSPHGYYRDRLSECCLITRSDEEPHTKPADRVLLSELNACTAGPYHLINTTVNLPNSTNREMRGRHGDFFVFSKHYCGSPMCGYYPTTELEKADPHLDLGTAISGAAVSSNMGWQTNNSLRLVMTLANVRLAIGCATRSSA
jgi:hypothetical protein